MKKMSVFSIAIMTVFPAFAMEDVTTLYGTEPAGLVASQCVVQESIVPVVSTDKEKKSVKKIEKIKDVENTEQVNDTEAVKKVKEVKETEEIKTIKEVYKTEKQPEQKEIQVAETIKDVPEQSYSNPETRFPRGLQLGVGVSATSGLNAFVGYNNKKFDSFWAKRFGIRFDFADYSLIKKKLDKEINEAIGDDGVEIKDIVKIDNFTMNAKHIGALIDFYPFGDTWFLGGWRISGGYFYGKLDLDADVHGKLKDGEIEFELNNHKYYYTGNEMRAKAMVDWKYNGPYVGTGFDWGLFWGFKMYFDAGIVFTGKTAHFDMNIPIDGLKNESGVVITENTQEYEQFNADKEQTVKDAQHEIKDYPYYPLVKLGVMYRF